jgi:hypothetical protein
LAHLALAPGMAAARVTGKGSDKAVVAAGKLAAADVPAGWVTKPQPKGESTLFKGVRGCKKQRTAAEGARKDAKVGRSLQFFDPASPRETTSVASTVHAFKSAKRATKFTDAFRDPTTARCIQQQLDQASGDSAGVGPATTAALTNLPTVGDARVGYESSVPLTARDQTVLLYYDVVEVRIGRAVVSLASTSLGQPFQEMPALLTRVAERVQRAQS